MARPVGYTIPEHWVTIQCVECGAEIKKRKSDPKRTCSKPCMVAFRNRRKRRQIAVLCKQCLKPFSLPRAWAERKGRGKHTGQFCSRPCAWAYWRANPKEHPSHKSARNREKWVDGQGYVWVFDPETGHRRREHHVVVERLLGRRLKPGENVHHRNGIRKDNRPENLEVWTRAQPSGQASEYVNEILRLRLALTRCTCGAGREIART